MFVIGLFIGTITGGALVLFTAIVSYRMAQIHAAEDD